MKETSNANYRIVEISFNNQGDLCKQLWTLVDPDWESHMPLDKCVKDKIIVEQGCDSPYGFVTEMRTLIESPDAEVVSINAKGYYALDKGSEDEQGSCKVALYIPTP